MIYLKRAVASLLFIAGLVGLLIGSSYMFVPKGDESEFGVEDPAANNIRGERDNSVDVLIFGDSESYSNITPMQIWKDNGIPTFICGTRSQRLNYTQILVERAFKTQKPKVVMLETNTIYSEVSSGATVVEFVSSSFSIFMYHNRWKTMLSGEGTATVSDDYKGYQYNSKCDPYNTNEYMIYSEGREPIADINKDYVVKIKEYCEQNGAKFILVSAPSAKNWNYERHNTIADLAAELGCEYLDLNLDNEKMGIDWSTDTRDKGDHLNHRGAVKASAYLGDYLSGLGLFTDKRNDPTYADWNAALARYELFVEQDK